MGILSFFSSKNPEEYEQKGDGLFEAKAFGKAKAEYERALNRLEKTSPWDDDYRRSLQVKIRRSTEALALEHKQTAADILEAGYVDDARQYLGLALELTEDPRLKIELEQLLQTLETQATEKLKKELPDVEFAGNEADEAGELAETVPEDPPDEYFMALIATLPEAVQKDYLSYGEAFKSGYLALNRGDFERAAADLTRAMRENPDPSSFIPLELATAYLNLEKHEDARSLLESFVNRHPDALPGYRMLCEIFWETKDIDRAEALLSSLPPELAESVAGYLLRGETLYHAGKYSAAKSFYREFLNTYGWNEPVALALAKTHETMAEPANARNIYREIMDNCRSCHARIDPFVKQKYADLCFDSGIYTTEVLELYLSLAREDSVHAAGYYQKISRIYEARGDQEQARRFALISEKYENKQ